MSVGIFCFCKCNKGKGKESVTFLRRAHEAGGLVRAFPIPGIQSGECGGGGGGTLYKVDDPTRRKKNARKCAEMTVNGSVFPHVSIVANGNAKKIAKKTEFFLPG